VVAGIADWTNNHSDLLRIGAVVFNVGSHESNVQDSVYVIDVYDESVLVAANIENDAISSEETCMPVSALNVFRSIPHGL